MIKRMEQRFTYITIGVVSIVLLFILVTINALTINQNIQNADSALERMITEGKNEMPRDDINPFVNNRVDDRFMEKDASRSFDIFIDEDGSITRTTLFERDDLSTDEANDLVQLVLDDNSEYGFADEFRYLKIEGNETRIIFLDYSFEKRSEENFMWMSLFVYLTAVLLVSILIRVVMKPFMKPIHTAYSKQKEFITNASHELKTPLTIISTDIQLIELETGESEWSHSINNQVERLKSLSNDLVTLSRLEEFDKSINFTTVCISDLVNDAVMGFEPAFDAKCISYNVSVEEDLYVEGNLDSLEQTLSVILNNALKYVTDAGTVDIKLCLKGKNIVFTAKNTATGLSKGSHNEFFERFYRGEKSRNSQKGGFGIGLAVASAIIEEHKGTIEANSFDGKSLEIKIVLKPIHT